MSDQHEPAWTNRLNTCKHHGDDHEACAVYGGRVPCDAEGGEAVAWRCTEKQGGGVDVVASVDTMETYKRVGRKIEPLYTHPPKQQSGVPEITDEIVGAATEAVHRNSEKTPVAVASHVLNAIWPLLSTALQPDKWIPCSERLPTEADEDFNGEVWVFDPYEPLPITLCETHEVSGPNVTHWMPTGLTRPAPPEQESE